MQTSGKVLAGAAATLAFLAAATAVVTPLLLKAPTDQSTHMRASGPATFLDTATGRPQSGTFVQVSTITTHLLGARKAGSATTAVYDQKSTTSFVGAGVSKVIRTDELTQAFDRSTGAGVPGKQGDTVGTTAHLFKLPFHTRKQTYAMWDETANRPVDLTYAGEKTIDGLPTYVFHREVTPTDLGPLPVFRAVPATWLGHSGPNSIPADEWYENTSSTLYVEPVTGSIVGGSSSPHLWAQTSAGERVDLLRVTGAVPSPADAHALVQRAKAARQQVQLLQRTPWVLGAAALMLLCAALLLGRRPEGTRVRPEVFLPAPREAEAVDGAESPSLS